jgi:hypothetical protein
VVVVLRRIEMVPINLISEVEIEQWPHFAEPTAECLPPSEPIFPMLKHLQIIPRFPSLPQHSSSSFHPVYAPEYWQGFLQARTVHNVRFFERWIRYARIPNDWCGRFHSNR